MGGRSLGWGAREKGRKMSGEMKVGGWVEEMSSFFLFGFFEGGVCLNRSEVWLKLGSGKVATLSCRIKYTPHECAYNGLRAL